MVEAFSFVRAWVEMRDGEPATATLLLNGESYWTGRAERLEHPVFDTRIPRKPCGIWVVLPAAIASPQVVTVTLVSGDAVLATADVDLAGRYHGFVDKIEFGPDGLLVEGWAHDLSRPLDALKLELRDNGVAIGTLTAGKSREDLRESKIGLGNHAFSERVMRPARRHTKIDDIAIVIAGTEIPLAQSDTLVKSWRDAARGFSTDALSVENPQSIVLATISVGLPASVIMGVCDKITEEEAAGWALDLLDKEQPVVLDLLINNFVVATTQTERYRADIGEKYGCNGFVGFHFEIIPQMRLGRLLNVAVVARKTGAALSQGLATIAPSFTKYLPYAKPLTTEQSMLRGLSPNKRPGYQAGHAIGEIAPSVAMIVLNRNGAALLDRHFDWFAQHNTYENVEHVIVDHGSTDHSRQVIEHWRAKGTRITLVERNGNYSFSASNNYAIGFTDAEFLIFCNNDIFFNKDALPPFIDALRQEGVGVAGIKLVDESKTGEDFGPRLTQHLGVFFNTAKYDRIVHPVEARFLPILEPYFTTDFEVPAVTGAFLGIERDDFLSVGGFCEGYFYGYEDIDLCLKVKLNLRKSVVVVASTEAIHFRGYSRKKTGLWGGTPMLRNSRLLSSRFGLAMRRNLRSSLFGDFEYWTATRPIIAFAVTSASPTTTAGDFYTAYELAREIAKLVDATFVFLEENRNWYEVKEVDLLVAMTHNYDLSLLNRPKQNLVTVGWARNWFSDWAKPGDHQFDIVFASCSKGAAAIKEGIGQPERVLRIATNPDRFYPDIEEKKTVDYVFTGSFWGHARDLIYLLEPAALPYSCELYGAGWDQVESLAPYSKGFANYDDLAGIYRRARVVIDDANSVTKEWGSVNSRVFDAISAGALVITNSVLASEDGFGGELPSFQSREELEGLLRRFCGNESERLAVLAKLQKIVCDKHSYADRARQFVATVGGAVREMFRVAIKVPCPSSSEAHLWGDYHFAQSLARELRALGHSVRLDLLDHWHRPNRLGDDVVICLRGLSSYTPSPDQINICWMISHPDASSLAELRAYDRVYVASEKHCDWLKQQGLKNVAVLLQCVDTDLFGRIDRGRSEAEFDVLFVGNSRNVLRRVVSDAIAIDAPLTVIGSGWEGLIAPEFILQTSVTHSDLPRVYSSARVVLNDHWDSMAEHGFISNRLFDCVAAGAYVISDEVDGISELFGPLVKQYRTREDLKRLIEEGLKGPSLNPGNEEALAVSSANSFRARARTISDFIRGSYERICSERLAEPETESSGRPGPRVDMPVTESAAMRSRI
jgi:GT2 family glycosyltransferase/spore maturation protein CgeB